MTPPRLTAAFGRLVRVCRRWTTTDTADVAADIPEPMAVLFRTATALVKGASEVNKLPVSCGRRCSACCRGEIVITSQEAAVIASRLTAPQAHAVRTAPRLTTSRKCPLLTSEGDCGVYSARPLVCRLYHTTSPASDCEDIDGTILKLEGADFELLRVVGWSPGIGELVQMVRAELEQPGKSLTLIKPRDEYKPFHEP